MRYVAPSLAPVCPEFKGLPLIAVATCNLTWLEKPLVRCVRGLKQT